MEITNTFTLSNEDGSTVEYTALNVFVNPETGREYVLYTETESVKNISGKEAVIHASVYNKINGQIVLEPIETEKEWGLVKNVIAKLGNKDK